MLTDAAPIILHQYDVSPFSEKVRVLFGIKGLEWRACEQPVIMPKPELTALTGGYRKIPVMQIGADIYCDTQIIARELERRFPSPSIFVGPDRGVSYGVGAWIDRALFMQVVTVVFAYSDFLATEEFIADRKALIGSFDIEALRAAGPNAADQLRAQLGWLEAQLEDKPFLACDRPGLADASAYHNVWFLRVAFPNGLALLDRYPRLSDWERRMKAIGHGTRSEIGREAALDIARAATSTEAEREDPEEPNGLKPGDRVAVAADDYGRDPIAGMLVSSSAQHIAIRRSDPRVGEVVVHFPRAGFVVRRE